MPTVEKRSISLPPELASLVDRAVAEGEFGNASEVIREALRQWKDRRDLHGYTVEELRLLWDEGQGSGTPRPLSDDYAARIKAEGRARLSGRDGHA
ncbi:transcriptional regulator [Jannaschia pagri]|uniref:Transcriptional regulator n=1 Tax=Jannaschia pagri TaxID=2829797 RepID=A0ABQ4NRU2_9RHOB|nr:MULTISPECIES: type II toxin-antitoxin system ParD family antitoxin [unclassified Jannaschia]GIT93339.1 transcriptional regulator [Jannaschia sp. AI_61]GIT97131.1 transcriptional regulator [Jannaschia sp. AI_62]